MDKSIEILQGGIDCIVDRSATRDDDTGKSMIRTVDIFDKLTGNDLSPREGWLFMACVKIARSQQGRFCLDDYIDGAAYIALAGEAGYGEMRPTRNGPSVGKDLPKIKAHVPGLDAFEVRGVPRATLDLPCMPREKTK